ncbi:ABC transporter ATP-binding protein [Actinomycetaceae bacterium L2_0104]
MEVRDVVRHQGSFTLGPIDFDVSTGSVVGFVGPNGAGKTTTLKCLLAMAHIQRGHISLLGRGAGLSHDRIGASFEDVALPPQWTARQAAKMGRRFFSGWNEDLFGQLLHQLNIPTNTQVKGLSRGERSKLSLSLALAHQPEFLILDEPTSGLDPVARNTVLEICRDFMVDESHSILFSTHITSDLENFADRLVVINRGSIVLDGQLDEVLESHAVVRGSEEDISDTARAVTIGACVQHGRFEGIIGVKDTALFDSRVVVEEPSIDELVVALCRQRFTERVSRPVRERN